MPSKRPRERRSYLLTQDSYAAIDPDYDVIWYEPGTVFVGVGELKRRSGWSNLRKWDQLREG